MGTGLKMMGKDFASFLLKTTSSPFAGLFIGIIVTAIIQSSSATTSMVVGFVASGVLTVRTAIPIVMGANIGTTVTNIMVSFVHISNKREFSRAFPAAVVHDIFNLLNVIILFPLEIFFHPIEKITNFLAEGFKNIGGLKFSSPLKLIVSPVKNFVVHTLKLPGWLIAIIGILVLFVSLKFLVDSMKQILSGKVEIFLDRYLFRTAFSAFFLGLLLTSVIQSSSVTTSLVVPLVGAGLLSIRQIFPYTVGANIGTTVTALLASFVTGSFFSVQTVFSHLMFNIIGTIIFLVLPLRILPIKIAEFLKRIVEKNRLLAIVYLISIFFVIPILMIIIFRR